MTRITQLAVRQKSVVILLAFALFVSGIVSWGRLQQELLPDIQLPIMTVIASLPGAGAEDVARQVTEPIEQSIANTAHLEQLQSTSANSVSLVVAQFAFGTDIRETQSTITQALASVSLPSGVEPKVSALNLNDQPVIVATVSAAPGADAAEAARIAREVLLPQIKALDGVSSADLTGGPTNQLQVVLKPDALARTGITPAQVAGILRANQITVPTGSLTTPDQHLPVSTEHHFTSVAEIQSLIVGAQTPAGSTTPQPVTLGQIADVSLQQVQESGYARTNGQPSLTLTVSKSSDANTVDVADAVQKTFADVQARYPGQVTVTTIQDLSIFIKQSRDGLVREGLLGAAFAVLTIFLFLLSLRSTLVAAVSIPLSILTALTVMGLTGLTINIITLGALAVAVGRVVDDAIVVLENIYRHRARGEQIGTAVVSGTREVATAITSSTLTTVAVFLPLGFVGGIVSQFFLPFALTVTFALLASLFVALSVVPVLAFFLVRKVDLKVDANGEPRETIWQRIYTPILELALRSRATQWATLGIAFLLFLGTTALVPLLPTQFIDVGGPKIVSVTVAPPPGASSDEVLARVAQVEQTLQADPQVELVQSTVPSDQSTGTQTLQSAFTGRAANSAVITVRLTDDANIAAERDEIETALAPAETDGYSVTVAEQQAFGGSGLSIIVSGDDPAAIHQASDALVADLATVPGVTNVSSDLAEASPQVRITVDPNKAAIARSSTAQVAQDVRTVLVGDSIGQVALDDGTAAELVVRVDTSNVTSVDTLAAIPVGSGIPLGNVATVEQVKAQGSVTRVDGAPAATIKGDITSKDQGAVSRTVQQHIDALSASGAIPVSVTVRVAGVTQQQNEAFGSLFFSMGVAILAVYIVMVLVFGSLVDPFVILFSLPLATIGAFTALLLTGRPIGISALIGFLMLIGIVVTNAIVLMDLVEQLRAQGYSTHEALVRGGRTRVRPILMTAVATILALLPVTAGLSEGSIIAAELGTVVIGGLFTSTILTLIIIPVIYSLVDGGKVRVARRFGSGDDEDPHRAEASATPA